MPTPQGNSPLDGWPRLRTDLTVVQTRARAGARLFLVTDPNTQETFEFGHEEWFLLQTFDGYMGADQAIERFGEEFGIELDYEDIDAFIESVSDWGLLDTSEPELEPEIPVVDDVVLGPEESPIEGEQVEDILPPPPRPRQAHSSVAQAELDEPPLSMVWFNPSRILMFLSDQASFLRVVTWVVPLLTVVAFFTIVNNVGAFAADFARYRVPLTLFHNLLFSMVTINLMTQIGRGMVARHVGADVPEFGIRMMIGLIPRFGVRVIGEGHLARRERLWLHGGTLLARLGLLSFSVSFWLLTRPSGTGLSGIFLLLSVVSTVSFFLTANPLIKGSGYSLLSVLLDSPDLRQRANRALSCKLTGRPLPYNLRDSRHFALSTYALASVIFLCVLFGLVFLFIGEWLEFNLRGTGVVIFLVLMTYLYIQFSRKLKERKKTMNQKKADMQQALEARFGPERAEQIIQQVRSGGPMQPGGPMPPQAMDAPIEAAPEPKRRRPWKRYVFLLVLALVCLLPYPYETGGPLTVLPTDRQEIYAEIESFIEAVYHTEGEALESGTVIAKLSSSEQTKNILTNKANLAEARAALEELLNTPTKEELQLAQQRVQTKVVRAKFSRESADRLGVLYKSGDVSLDKFEDAKRRSEVDRLEAMEEKANLEKVESGPHPQTIEAARFEVQRLEEQLIYLEEQLSHTDLIMPINGRIVTPNLDHFVGKYLDKGDLFATVENDRDVRVTIQIPQSDISEVALNAKVRLKSWAYPDRTFEGVVTEISPVVTEESFGEVVAVNARIENPDGILKSGMTGFGKIDGGEKMVFFAFTRAFVRFFMIEIWSWIP